MWQNWTNIVSGILVIVFAFIKFPPDTALWVFAIMGLVIAFVSAIAIVSRGSDEETSRLRSDY